MEGTLDSKEEYKNYKPIIPYQTPGGGLVDGLEQEILQANAYQSPGGG